MFFELALVSVYMRVCQCVFVYFRMCV